MMRRVVMRRYWVSVIGGGRLRSYIQRPDDDRQITAPATPRPDNRSARAQLWGVPTTRATVGRGAISPGTAHQARISRNRIDAARPIRLTDPR